MSYANLLWLTLLAAGVLAWLTKLAGYSVPQHWLQGPRLGRVMALLPVALLAALVALQGFANGQSLALDARAAGLATAALALAWRAPFLLVIMLAAVVAAGLRALGWAA